MQSSAIHFRVKGKEISYFCKEILQIHSELALNNEIFSFDKHRLSTELFSQNKQKLNPSFLSRSDSGLGLCLLISPLLLRE